MEVLSAILNYYKGKFSWFFGEVLHPHLHNYFYWLLGISLVCWGIELAFPWRKNQKGIREDFWLDGFYMLFNFFFLYIIGFGAAVDFTYNIFNALLASVGIQNISLVTLQTFPYWVHFAILFVLKDVIQYFIHRLLHKVPFLWEFHKVHHSVKQMGFAAHLRYHWVENVVYKTLQFIPLYMMGYGLQEFFVADIIAISIGHLNHSNLRLPLGYLKYILNNPQMHLWHHAKDIPNQTGINFGISLSIWDYLFGTAHFPHEDPDLVLGFPDEEGFPKDFISQEIYPLKK